MKKSVSIVEARRDLGRLAEEVRRTGQPVVLTRRGRPVARIAPEPVAEAATAPQRRDGFAALRGTLRMNCSFDALVQAVRELRDEFTQNLERRARSGGPKHG
jgi:prevent-host-death family protein